MSEYEKRLLRANNPNWFLSYIKQHPKRLISTYLSEIISIGENETCKHSLNQFIKVNGSIANGISKTNH